MIPVVSWTECIVHSLLWQGLWLWLVWSAGHGATAAPLLATGLLLALWTWRSGPAGIILLRLVAVGVLWGVVGDGLLAAGNLVSYATPNNLMTWCPAWWILALWAQFAAALVLPLRRVLTNPLVALGAGLVGGPLAYLGGQALGAISFPSGQLGGLTAVAMAFGIGTPLLVLLANRWLGGAQAPAPMVSQPTVGG